MSEQTLLTVNCGSSSLKAALFKAQGRRDFYYGPIGSTDTPSHEHAFEQLLRDLNAIKVDTVAHRITHGGDMPEAVRVIDAAEKARLAGLIPWAPLHQPLNLRGVELCEQHF